MAFLICRLQKYHLKYSYTAIYVLYPLFFFSIIHLFNPFFFPIAIRFYLGD